MPKDTQSEIDEQTSDSGAAAQASLFNGFFVALVILPAMLLLAAALRNAITWHYFWDLPPLLYVGFLIDHFGHVPFVDIFDMNLIGAHLTYMWIGRIFGFSDVGIRWADMAFMAAIMVSTALLVRQMGFRVVLLAPFLFIFRYLLEGPGMTLQREIVALPLVILGAASATAFPHRTFWERAVTAGIFFGAAATIKPHLVIGLPAVVLYLGSEAWEPGMCLRTACWRLLHCAFWAGVGLALPLLGTAAYLQYHGALGGMLDMARNYFPLYSAVNGDLTVMPAGEFPGYLIRNFVGMRRLNPLFMAGGIALMYGMSNPAYSAHVRKQVAMLMLLALAYWLYPVFGGKFWKYHDFPFYYFACTGMALAVGPWSPKTLLVQRIVPIFLVIVTCANVFGAQDNFAPLFPPENAKPLRGRPVAIAEYLRAHLRPGDKVQPVDVVSGGVVHGLLLAQADIATPFIYWFHFYHHVSNPYIQRLRDRLMTALQNTPPRFIVQSTVDKSWIKGVDSAKQFPAFDTFLKARYQKATEGDGYIIWERMDPS